MWTELSAGHVHINYTRQSELRKDGRWVERPLSLCVQLSYIYVCTVWLCNNVPVNNALVRPYYVRTHIASNITWYLYII